MPTFQRSTLLVCRNGGRLRLLLIVGVGLGLMCVTLNSPQRILSDGFTFSPPLPSSTNDTSNGSGTTLSPAFLDKSSLFLTVSNNANKTDNRPECPPMEKITTFIKHLSKSRLLIEDLKEEEIEALHSDLLPGGEWKPKECRARSKVAIIVPYRDRKSHLMRLLDFLIPVLKRQLLDFRFIVTEQMGDDLFNKGRIMNAAYKLAETMGVGCVIFHDVDMFPLDDRIAYDCPMKPRHLGAYVDTLGYFLLSKELVGGVLAINMDDYRAVNGYSNMFWGWGGEDDELGRRFSHLNYTIERLDSTFARYSMLKHTKRKRTAPRMITSLVDSTGKRWEHDGVNEKDKWIVVNVKKRPLYFHCLVDVGKSPSFWKRRT